LAVEVLIQESDRQIPAGNCDPHNQRDQAVSSTLFRVDIVTGRSELLYENRDYVFLITDSDFRLRLGGPLSPKDGSAEVFERRATERMGHRS